MADKSLATVDKVEEMVEAADDIVSIGWGLGTVPFTGCSGILYVDEDYNVLDENFLYSTSSKHWSINSGQYSHRDGSVTQNVSFSTIGTQSFSRVNGVKKSAGKSVQIDRQGQVSNYAIGQEGIQVAINSILEEGYTPVSISVFLRATSAYGGIIFPGIEIPIIVKSSNAWKELEIDHLPAMGSGNKGVISSSKWLLSPDGHTIQAQISGTWTHSDSATAVDFGTFVLPIYPMLPGMGLTDIVDRVLSSTGEDVQRNGQYALIELDDAGQLTLRIPATGISTGERVFYHTFEFISTVDLSNI